MVGVVAPHPHYPGDDFDPADPCKHVIESPAFRSRFGSTTEVELFGMIRSYSSRRRGGPIGRNEVRIADRNGELHDFHFESFAIKYYVLTLGVYKQPAATAVPQI